MTVKLDRSLGPLIAFVVISLAVVGYFVGLQAPMPDRAASPSPSHPHKLANPSPELDHPSGKPLDRSTRVMVPAKAYSDMQTIHASRKAAQQSRLSDLKSTVDPLAEFTISEAEKLFALQLRSLNRAFNGAPPTVPHPIEQTTVESCLACHGEGLKSETLRASKMSHQFLANCTQCHVESNSLHLPASAFVGTTFVGLPAPLGGPKAYDGAPPQIPHTTWMRVDCMSCHGLNGVQGIRTTHPWRQNCQQCHAPSAESEQLPLNAEPHFLSPPQVH
jgi:cytochrome c-type protein NapB